MLKQMMRYVEVVKEREQQGQFGKKIYKVDYTKAKVGIGGHWQIGGGGSVNK